MGSERVTSGSPASEAGSFDTFLRNVARTAEPALHHGRVAWPVGHALVEGRFQVLRQIGRGGMGVVYEALDTERRSRTALKMLAHVDASSIYRLKTEFRILSELVHPHLVRLHELFFDQDQWFFTMDLVDGVPFDRHVRPDGQLAEARLARSFTQLASAVAAIHQAGKLHRDLKPSNVLVREPGEVVLLDFGLASDPEPGGLGQTITAQHVTGTPAYMAPEQAASGKVGPKSDVYALGVMLFEALTGRLPFEGSAGEMMAAKQRDEPPAPAQFVDDVSPAVSEFCHALIARDPEHRPDSARVHEEAVRLWRALAHAGAGGEPVPLAPHVLRGRDIELSALREAYAQAERGQAVAAFVTGASGMGKSALCAAFVAGLRGQAGVVTLLGRCHERESVPFKALDSLLDALGRYLRRLAPDEAAALMPRDVFALARLFPTLGRVKAVAAAPVLPVPDEHELKRRAFSALLELLGRIRDRHPLVLYVDDFQWADRDSLAFLRHLVVERTQLPVLLLLVQRVDSAAQAGAREDLETVLRTNPQWRTLQLALGPLAEPAARDLAHELLADGRAGEGELARAVARVSGGSPFFTAELARYVKRTGTAPSSLALADVLAAHLAEVSPPARRALELLALSGQPLECEFLLEAAEAEHRELDELRHRHLVRGGADGSGKLVECYHDRIRETVCGLLGPAEIRAYFQSLARTLRGQPERDLELASRCFEGAGDPATAARLCARAAEQAAEALAFDHAAMLYRRTLKLHPWPPEQRADFTQRLGFALENGGRCTAAAEAYQEAAALTAGDLRLELLRRATEQLLATGHVEEGTALSRAICGELQVDVPKHVAAAVASLVFSEVSLRVEGRADTSGPALASPRKALRLKTCETVLKGLIGRLPIHTASVSASYLRMALADGGVEERVRALGFNAYVHSLIRADGARPHELLRRMDNLARRDGRPELLGFAGLMKGTAAYHWERFREARDHLAGTLAHLRGCRGVAWEIDAANVYDQLSAHHRGDYADLARTAPALADEAATRGRIWAFAMLSGFAGAPAWLTPDDAAGYRRQLHEAKRSWPALAEPQWPDYLLLSGELLLTVYEGRPELGVALLKSTYRAYARSTLTRGSGTARVGYAIHSGRCLVSALRASENVPRSERAAQEKQVADCVTTLRKHPVARGLAMAHVFEASLALAARRVEPAIAHLRQALSHFDAGDARMHAAATRFRLGALEGGDGGRALARQGEASMRTEGVRHPDALAETCCPGVRVP